jgi:hypothetical protein
MQTLTIQLFNRQQARAALQSQLYPFLAAVLQADQRYTLEVRPETRSLKENALLHSLLTQISNQIEWAGQKRDAETWKRLMTAAWLRATGQQVEILPAIDGHGIDVVFRKTSKLSRAECADLIEFVLAWSTEQGVKFAAWERDL